MLHSICNILSHSNYWNNVPQYRRHLYVVLEYLNPNCVTEFGQCIVYTFLFTVGPNIWGHWICNISWGKCWLNDFCYYISHFTECPIVCSAELFSCVDKAGKEQMQPVGIYAKFILASVLNSIQDFQRNDKWSTKQQFHCLPYTNNIIKWWKLVVWGTQTKPLVIYPSF